MLLHQNRLFRRCIANKVTLIGSHRVYVVLIKAARYLSFYLIDFVKFVFYSTGKHSSKRKQPENKGRVTLNLLNKPAKHVYPYIHWKQSFRSFTIDNILS
jgi:hypothetical protein